VVIMTRRKQAKPRACVSKSELHRLRKKIEFIVFRPRSLLPRVVLATENRREYISRSVRLKIPMGLEFFSPKKFTQKSILLTT
jgi:hypothetical protein